MPNFVESDGRSWRVDATHWPVLLVTRLSPDIEDHALFAAMRAADAMIDGRRTAFALVLDQRRARAPSASQRELIAQQARMRAADAQRRCRGTAFVYASPVTRGLMAASLWLKPSDAPTKVFADLAAAVRWANTQATTEPMLQATPAAGQ